MDFALFAAMLRSPHFDPFQEHHHTMVKNQHNTATFGIYIFLAREKYIFTLHLSDYGDKLEINYLFGAMKSIVIQDEGHTCKMNQQTPNEITNISSVIRPRL